MHVTFDQALPPNDVLLLFGGDESESVGANQLSPCES